ncbi:MAG: methyltransferase domain-containing protein [Jiangellaceae bacterium]
MPARMTRRLEKPQAPVDNVGGVAERLPMPDGIADAVAASLDLCSVCDLDAAVAEIRRMLPEGEFAMLVHVRSDGWRCHRQETERRRGGELAVAATPTAGPWRPSSRLRPRPPRASTPPARRAGYRAAHPGSRPPRGQARTMPPTLDAVGSGLCLR